MALIFEFCFYVGAVLALAGVITLARTLLKGEFRKAIAPLGILMLAAVLLVGPAIVSRSMAVDLGPRETVVNGELHISLTGWDGESYDFLSARNDTIVLQMGNADVTDDTLDQLTRMTQLRELDLNDSKITDAGLAKIARLQSLTSLRLRGTAITDSGFQEHLATMPNLRQLDLRDTAVSPETVSAWKAAGDSRKVMQ